MTEQLDSIYTDNKQTSHGLKQLEDFNNWFGYGAKTVSELIGSNKGLTLAELHEKYPLARAYLDNVKTLTNYIKSSGGGVDVDSYVFRVHHITPMKEFIDISNRMQFIKALQDQLTVYQEENMGWGMIEVIPTYEKGKLISTEVKIAGKTVDLSKPVLIQTVDWYGKMRDGLQLIDKNYGRNEMELQRDERGGLVMSEDGHAVYVEKTGVPVNLAIQITDDSTSNEEYIQMLYHRDGAINKSDMQKTLQFSPLSYLVVRVLDEASDEANDIFPTGFETPIFKELDYCHDIDFIEYVRTLERYHQLVDLDLFYNSREFSLLNLFRWGIVDKATWDRGLSIFKAIDKAEKKWGNDTIIDSKVVAWGMPRIDEVMKEHEASGSKPNADEIVTSGSAISKIASVLSQSYFSVRALVVHEVKEDDVEFRDTYITFRSKKERTTKFASSARVNTDVYKIIETDKDGKFIRILNPVDVFAIVNYGITTTVVRFEAELATAEGVVPGEVSPAKEHIDYYNAIGSFVEPPEWVDNEWVTERDEKRTL